MDLTLPTEGGLEWSVEVRSTGAGRMPLSSHRANVPLRTASVGKVLLLLEVARALAVGELLATEPLTRTADDWVRDSGLWHTLDIDTLPLGDVAALVGSVSDNLATNVLLRKVGLAAVASSAAYLHVVETALHDQVRETRGPGHAPTLSTGTAAELCGLMLRLAEGRARSAGADRLVRQWLSGNVDQSMVGSAFVDRLGLDPIAHHVSLGGELAFFNKTGTDAGVRADVGAATLEGRTVAWAAIANWDPALPCLPRLDHVEGPERPAPGAPDPVAGVVLEGMRRIGDQAVAALMSDLS